MGLFPIFCIFISIMLIKGYFPKGQHYNEVARTEDTMLVDHSFKKKSDYELLKEVKGQVVPWGIHSLGVEKLQKHSQTADKVKVAILDSGINTKHKDLHGKVVAEYNAVNPGEPVNDDNGHGTAIAGVIAANDNQHGIKGIAPNIEIYSVKVLDNNGKGDTESLIRGIHWCIEKKVEVINISFGTKSDLTDLRESIESAINAGIIVVAASGNNYGLQVDYPAAYSEVISVTAINKDYKPASFSPTGKIDFSMPGVEILTTTRDGVYGQYSGTSFAAAHMSGVISLILENAEHYDINREDNELPSVVLSILKEHSVQLGNQSKLGNGFVKLF
ncbi:hypothetical protein J22TS1_04770 [Siminovitchia terrae]|nr:hypothetical protein J22TS1_04770 [Siminovitchia terrae]